MRPMRSLRRTRTPRSRLRTLIAVPLLALTLLAASACAGDDGGDAKTVAGAAGGPAAPARIRIGYQLIPNGDLLVKNRKWLESALPDTRITWTKFDSGGDVNTAMIAGRIDIGLAGSSPVTKGLSAPLNIAYQVPWIFDVIGANESLVVRKGKVASVADLAGKRVATPYGSTAHYSLLAALTGAGVDPAKVKIIDLEPPDILAAWQRGDIDGAYVWTPTLAELRKSGDVLVTSRQLAEQGKATADLAVVRKEFADRYPTTVQTWIKEQDRAVGLIREKPDEAAGAIGAELNLPADQAKAQIAELVLLDATQQKSAQYLGTPATPGAFAQNLLGAAEFLKGQGKIDAVPPLATFRAGIDTRDLADAFPG
ncbi:glycine betaine ABC transporter substrate-binding protein [Embleya sp. AB8]|uniref:taurine ABC transporter substrate-binding protein n=1 Tax=Embleya sp. AB8 TaxID=3156304 RepID=UPI003C715830